MDSLKNQAVSAKAEGTGSVTLPIIPANMEQLQQLPEAALAKPEHTAALAIAALCIYPVNREAALKMLTFLQGPKGLSAYER